MNILIVTLGSRGDVQPYVALGKGLKEAGHQVTICTSAVFQSFITNHGLDYGYMNNELIQLIDSDAGREAIENTNNLWGAIRTTIKLFNHVKPMFQQTLHDIWQTAQAVNPDVMILASKAAVFAESIADKLGIPLLMSMPFPQLVPSAQMPSLGFPDLKRDAGTRRRGDAETRGHGDAETEKFSSFVVNGSSWESDLKIGAWYNRLTYWIVHRAVGLYSSIPNEFRHQVLQLPPKPKHLGILHRADGSPIPQLHCYSEQVVPRPTDWPDSCLRQRILVSESAG